MIPWEPVVAAVGLVAAAAVTALAGQWYMQRQAVKRAESPAGLAEARATEVAAALSREKWVDESTRVLFAELRQLLTATQEEATRTHAELVQTHAGLAEARIEIRGLRSQIGTLAAEVERVQAQLAECQTDRNRYRVERDEAVTMVDIIRRAGGAS